MSLNGSFEDDEDDEQELGTRIIDVFCDGEYAEDEIRCARSVVEVYERDMNDESVDYEFAVMQNLDCIGRVILIDNFGGLNKYLASVAPIIQCSVATASFEKQRANEGGEEETK